MYSFANGPCLLFCKIIQANKQCFFQAKSFNVDPDLVRISVGLEEVSDLRSRFQTALDAVEKAQK
jgi:cystathionine beta-lyase/cystathionine gamma-synthase